MDPLDPLATPYPGLRPFRTDEAGVFFGRERQTDELLAKLQRHRFIAVTGPSGCGGEVLPDQGRVDSRAAGRLHGRGWLSRWRICQSRPGQYPISNLAAALAPPDVLGTGARRVRRRRLCRRGTALRPARARRGCTRVVCLPRREASRPGRPVRGGVPLPGADRPGRGRRLRTAAARECRASRGADLRRDHDAVRLHGPLRRVPRPAGSHQRQSVPDAAAHPRRVCSGHHRAGARVRREIDPALVNRLLNDFGPRPGPAAPPAARAHAHVDPPVAWGEEATHRTPVQARGRGLRGDRRARGGALGHADEVLAELAPAQQHLAQVLFRRLTERGVGLCDNRAPAPTRRGRPVIARVEDPQCGRGRRVVPRRRAQLRDSGGRHSGQGHLARHRARKPHSTMAHARGVGRCGGRICRRLPPPARHGAAVEEEGRGTLVNPDLELALAWERRECPDLGGPLLDRTGFRAEIDFSARASNTG